MSFDEQHAQALRENHRLRMLLCEVLKALGNGSGASPECSLEFLASIPEEVRLVVADLRASHPEYRSSGEREPLTQDEIAFVLNELHPQGHGHGSSLDDFEPECPSCTAADKLKAALAGGVKTCDGGQQ